MIYLELLWVFFYANFLGFGGGPAFIPLIEHEAVTTFAWFSETEFAEIVAMGNALPGPIAPQLAAYVGYAKAGIGGASVALFATIAPSLTMMFALMRLLTRHKDAPQIKKLTQYIRPTIAVLLVDIALRNFISAWVTDGWVHVLVLSAGSWLGLVKFKLHPALVVVGALGYGALVLG